MHKLLNKKAPQFTLGCPDDVPVRLSSFKGEYVVLYFYPRDNTPGCTIEAQDFTRLKKKFQENNAVIIGISTDSCSCHQKFMSDQKLNILLLSDDKKEAHKKYGTWGKKSFMGKEHMGTLRTTFLIDPEGYIVNVWENVKVKDHAKDVLAFLDKIVEEQ
ncbi:thioredoxin-dependent thiol peroxidase [Candidatus Woesearchaeota archaeon]|nr:thioredoxin-dependent thiol peroxidase [Candidatus Woesearchaeota archaeon]